MKLVWSKNAREELLEITTLISRDKKQAAFDWANKVIRVTSRLEHFSRSGRIVPEFRMPDTREVIVGSYRIIYKLTSRITILTVFHGARKLGPQHHRRESGQAI